MQQTWAWWTVMSFAWCLGLVLHRGLPLGLRHFLSLEKSTSMKSNSSLTMGRIICTLVTLLKNPCSWACIRIVHLQNHLNFFYSGYPMNFNPFWLDYGWNEYPVYPMNFNPFWLDYGWNEDGICKNGLWSNGSSG